MIEGAFLTQPGYFKKKYSNLPCEYIQGAIYDQDGLLLTESQRKHSGALGLNDPPYLPFQSYKRLRIEGTEKCLYLGNHFSQYGHFLLETLPMLHYISSNESYGVFNHLPFGKNRTKRLPSGLKSYVLDRQVIDSILDLLDIDRRRILINSGAKMSAEQTPVSVVMGMNFRCSFLVPSRPVCMDSKLLDPYPYQSIVSRLHQKCESLINKMGFHEKIFLDRKPKFYSDQISNSVISIAKSFGFKIIKPDAYSISDQVALLANASLIVGFSGSHLHNCIFSKKLDTVLEIGWDREIVSNPNQTICSEITKSKLIFCPNSSIERIEEAIANIV